MRPKTKTITIVFCALFTALIAVGAFVKIQIPFVPITLQTFFVSLSGLLLGKNKGAISVLSYVAIGLMGIPIFTQGGGLAYVLKPIFGYLLGFILGSYVTGLIAHRSSPASYLRLLLACFAGLGVIYAAGMLYYWLISTFVLGLTVTAKTIFVYCFLAFVPGDTILSFVAAFCAKRLLPQLKSISRA